MRRPAWALLVLFVFAIPWEYSLDFPAPYGNIARVLGILTVLAAVPAVLQAGTFRRLSAIHWLTLALYLWFCATFFWTVTPHETLTHLRGYAQEMMLVWLVWEFAQTQESLRLLLRAWLAGSWVLAILTITAFLFVVGSAADQARFAAAGQDPNDAARFLCFGFPIAGLLLDETESRFERALWLCYFPAGFAGVLLTASRSGLLVAMVALAGCGIAGFRRRPKAVVIGGLSVTLATLLIFSVAPPETLTRLGTTAEIWQRGDLNQRVNIWSAGWQAFERAPLIGHGVGSFAIAAGLGPEDTAHNTVLSIVVESGLCGLALAMAVFVFSVKAVFSTRGRLKAGLLVLMLVWAISSLTGTVWENRQTWLLFGIAAAWQGLGEDATIEMVAFKTLNTRPEGSAGWV